MTDGQAAIDSPAQRVEPADPLVNDALRFLKQRDLPLAEAANDMRETLGIPFTDNDRDVAGCDGPVPKMERKSADLGAGTATSQARLDVVIAELIDHGPADLAAAVTGTVTNGGHIRIDEGGRLDDATIALQVGDDLIVSHAWLTAAVENPASIHGNLAHEFAGHMSYGTPLSCLILESALAGSAAIADFDKYRAAYLTYVYPETEIYAELHELPYLTDAAIGDDPYVDIIVQVHKIEAAYPAELARLILDWLLLRCDNDRTLSNDARFYCEAALR